MREEMTGKEGKNKMINYFSDTNSDTKETISVCVWNGVVVLYNELLLNNKLAEKFPLNCQNGQGICGVDEVSLSNAIKAEIPNIEMPIQSINEISENDVFSFDASKKEKKVFLYDALDLIEFLYRHLCSPQQIGRYHEYYSHQHYVFNKDISNEQENFISKINTIFHRNGLPYRLNDGKIERIIDETMKEIVERTSFYTTDGDLNSMLNIAYTKFKSPKKEIRHEALEKIWDAFERIKTIYSIELSMDKKQSIEKLIKDASDENEVMKILLTEDSHDLSKIGNNTQIRHHETDRIAITNERYIDYLFFRVSNIMQLFLKNIEKK